MMADLTQKTGKQRVPMKIVIGATRPPVAAFICSVWLEQINASEHEVHLVYGPCTPGRSLITN